MAATEKAIEQASRLALAYPGRSIDAGHLASWAEELAEIPDVADEVVRRLRRGLPHPPSVAELLGAAREVRSEQPIGPALPAGEWTEQDEREASEVGRRLFAEARGRWRSRSGEPVPEAPPVRSERVYEDPAVIERRRRESLEALRGLDG